MWTRRCQCPNGMPQQAQQQCEFIASQRWYSARYRVRIDTFADGHREFCPQYRKWNIWWRLSRPTTESVAPIHGATTSRKMSRKMITSSTTASRVTFATTALARQTEERWSMPGFGAILAHYRGSRKRIVRIYIYYTNRMLLEMCDHRELTRLPKPLVAH